MNQGIGRSKQYALAALVAAAPIVALACNQRPDPRQTSTAGSNVVAVPSVIGVGHDAALTVLSLQTLEGKVVGAEETCSKPEGAVVSQDPAGMTQAAAGSEVRLVLAERTPLPVPEDGTVLAPGASHAASGRDGQPTGVSFTLVGEACASGMVVVSHPIAGSETYELNTGDQSDRTLVYGAGEIAIRFDSPYEDARLVVTTD